MRKVMEWLRDRADEERERIARGDPGIPLDPRTGEPDVAGPEGQWCLARRRARSDMLREAMYCVRLLSGRKPRGVAALRVFLQDPHDGLVVETLRAFAQWRAREVLPALLELYRLYPGPDRWDPSPILAAADAGAKAGTRWAVVFGHPGKQRRRPRVVEALRRCIETITGEALDGPDALERFLERQRRRGRRSAA